MEERIYDIRVKEGEKACDTDKCILKQDGTVAYMNHNGHWNHDTLIGCLIKLSIGTYRYIAKEKIDKKWNMTISNGLITIVGDRQMLRSRKKMNDKYIVTKVKEAIKTIKDTIVEKTNNLKKLIYQLCLPEPKEVIDRLVEELNHYIKENNKKAKNLLETITTYEETMEMWSTLSPFAIKIQFLSDASEDLNRHKEIYRILVNAYHPDKTKQNTHDKFAYIKMIFKGENNLF